MAGFGIQKRGTSPLLVKRKGFSSGSSDPAEDKPSMHESAESTAEEAKETRLEKKGYKETKTGRMVKDTINNKKEGWSTFGGNEKYVPKKREYEPYKNLKFAKGGQVKVGKVMREFKAGKLHSGKKGPVVKSRKQAIAIALSEAGMSKKKKK